MARRINLRHREAERRKLEKDFDAAHDEATKINKALILKEETTSSYQRNAAWAEDAKQVAGSLEFSEETHTQTTTLRRTHLTDYMYSLNDADISDLPDLLNYRPSSVERTIRELPNETSITLTASFSGGTLATALLEQDYRESIDRQASRFRQFLFKYEGTVYSLQTLDLQAAEYAENIPMRGMVTSRTQTTSGGVTITANAAPDRHISKRGTHPIA